MMMTEASKSYRILVVDDEAPIRNEVGAIISELGHRPVSVECAEDAFDILEFADQKFDLVLTDIAMPGVDGLDFLKRANADHPEVPVAIMTGHADIDAAVKAMHSGAFDFISKPFGYVELEDLVKRLGKKVARRHPMESSYVSEATEHYDAVLPSDIATVNEFVKEWREHYRPVFMRVGVSPFSVAMCVQEALNNGVIHGHLQDKMPKNLKLSDNADMAKTEAALGNAGEVSEKKLRFNWEIGLRRLCIEVIDEGQGFDYKGLDSLENPADDPRCGRGLTLIKNIMSDVRWEGCGNRVRMCLDFEV